MSQGPWIITTSWASSLSTETKTQVHLTPQTPRYRKCHFTSPTTCVTRAIIKSFDYEKQTYIILPLHIPRPQDAGTPHAPTPRVTWKGNLSHNNRRSDRDSTQGRLYSAFRALTDSAAIWNVFFLLFVLQDSSCYVTACSLSRWRRQGQVQKRF